MRDVAARTTTSAMRSSLGLVSVFAWLSLSSGAVAQSRGRDHDGFMLRLTAGLGYGGLGLGVLFSGTFQ